MSHRLLLTIPLFVSMGACRRDSPAADAEFSDTLIYLLASIHTAESAELAVAMRDLEQRIASDIDLDSKDTVERSLQPARLTEQDIESIDRENTDRDPAAAIPIAVAARSAFPTPEHMALQLMPDQRPIEPYSPDKYDRSFLEGEDCFLDRACDTLRTSNDLTKENLLMTIDYILLKDFRWVDLSLPDPEDASGEPVGEERWAVLGRSWTDRSYSGRDDKSHIHQSYTMEVWIPDGGGVIRMQALWSETEFEGLSVSDEAVISTTRSGIDKNFESGEEYLEEG